MKTNIQLLFNAVICLLCLLSITNIKAQFSAGNVVVLQAGDGVNTLTNTGNPIVLREFNTSGAPTFSMSAPTTGTNALLISGSATSEGGLSLSANGKFLVFGGYLQSLPNSISLAGSSSGTINRGIGVVSGNGNFSLAVSSPSFYSAGNIRSATSDGLNNFWAAGSNDGTDYFGSTSLPSNVQNLKVNQRSVAIFNNQLYYSTQSSSGTPTLLGVYNVGTGLPKTSSQTSSCVINTGTGSQPSQFYFSSAPTPTVCYIADSRNSSSGGVQKWVYSSSTWSLAYTLPTIATGTIGAVGVIVDFSGANPKIYATTAESNFNRLVAIDDVGASSTPTTLATSPSGAIFRTLAFSPCDAPIITNATSSGSVCANQTLSLNVTASGSSPFTYSWAGAGAFNSATVANPLVTNANSGNYLVSVTNACGTASAIVSASVGILPNISANTSSSMICMGQSVTVNGIGASTYTWSSGILDGVAFTPTSSSTYTVFGTANNGCVNSATIDVMVNSLPIISVNSASICTGQSATLTANGASTYTWSNANTGNSIVVTPTTTNAYTVVGTSSLGCTNASVAQVVVLLTPTITVNSGTICVGNSTTLTANGVSSFTWDTGANTNSIIITPTSSTVYSVSGNIAGCPTTAFASASVIVNNLPIINISTTANSLCFGQSATLTVTGANTYTWNNSSNTNAIVVTPTTSSNYSVVGTSSVGCSNSATTQITVVPLPTITVSSNTICAGNSTTLIASGVNTYTWNTGVNTNSIVITPTSSTVYSVSGNVNGCVSTTSQTANVIVNSSPTLNIVSTTSLLCVGQSATLSASGANSYIWNGLIFSSTFVINPTITTSYTVMGIGTNSCTQTVSFVQNVSLCTGIHQSYNASVSDVYPNPVNSNLTIEFYNNTAKHVEIIDLFGKNIFSVSNYENGILRIDVSAYKKGIYFLTIQDKENSITTKKIVVE